jgi:hypothetical protein
LNEEMTMTRTLIALCLLANLAGCPSAGDPPPPALGAQIDRMGRAGVNTALTDPFWDTSGDGMTGRAAHTAKQDAYNRTSDPARFGESVADIKKALAVYDSLDQDIVAPAPACGNQLAFGALGMPDYTLLATVLADDQLYVNLSKGTCQGYLAVEAATLGLANDDCGGRTPLYNTIDITYAALANATLLGMSPLPNLNGVARDDGAHTSDAFPFFAAPVN